MAQSEMTTKMTKEGPKTITNSNRFRFVPPYSARNRIREGSRDNHQLQHQKKKEEPHQQQQKKQQKQQQRQKQQQQKKSKSVAGTDAGVFCFDDDSDEEKDTSASDSEMSVVPDASGDHLATCPPQRSGGHGNAEKAGKKKPSRTNSPAAAKSKDTSARARSQCHLPFLKSIKRVREELAVIRERQRFLKQIILQEQQTRAREPFNPASLTTTTPTTHPRVVTVPDNGDSDSRLSVQKVDDVKREGLDDVNETSMTSTPRSARQSVRTRATRRAQSQRLQLLL